MIAIICKTVRASARATPTPTDLFLLTAILWCALQGIISCAAMCSGIHTLQLIAATYIGAAIGPIAGRYFPAPRLAMLLFWLCDLPFVAGCSLAENPWFLIIAAQTPMFFFACKTNVDQLRTMSIALVQAQDESRRRAEHDPLTGLLNRAGLMKVLTGMQRGDRNHLRYSTSTWMASCL